MAQAVAGGAFTSGLEHYQQHGRGEGRDPNQPSNLPEHIIDSYIEAGQEIVVANGDFTLTQDFQDAHPPGLFERNEQGQVLGADGTPFSGQPGSASLVLQFEPGL